MAEIDTKPFDSVQDAIILFEERIDKNKNNMSSNKEEKGGECSKDFTNCRLQLEDKEQEKDLSFFEFGASCESPEELLNWIKLYKAETDKYKEKFRKAQELFFEFEKGDYPFRSWGDLKPQFSAADGYGSDSPKRGETMEAVTNVNETFSSQLPRIEAEGLPSQKQFVIMEDLENELLKEVIVSEYLHLELKQSKEAQVISSKSALSIMKELNLLKSEAEKMKLISSDRANCINVIEKESKRMTEELKISMKKMNGMNSQNEILVSKIQRMEEEISRSSKRELELQAKLHEFLTEKSEDGCEIDELRAELEEKNAETSELKRRLEEASRRAEMAEKAKFAIEDQLRKWREQRRLRRVASEALKEYAAKNPDTATRPHKKPPKRTFSKPEPHCVPSALPKRTVSGLDGRQSKYAPLANFLKIKFKPA